MCSCLLWKLDYVFKELAFVNAKNIEMHPLVSEIFESGDCNSLAFDSAMCYNCDVITIALVCCKFDLQDSLLSDFMLSTASDQFRCLSGEHASHDQFYAASLLILGKQHGLLTVLCIRFTLTWLDHCIWREWESVLKALWALLILSLGDCLIDHHTCWICIGL